MGRRRHGFSTFAGPTARSSLGDTHLADAITALSKTCGATVATMLRYEPSIHQTIPMLFRDDAVQRIKAAQGLIDPSSSINAFDIMMGVALGLNFTTIMPTPTEDAFLLQHERARPLLHWITEVQAIHNRFEEVKGVLRWLNANATPGAIRYYFPSAMKLCPRSPAFTDMEAVPTRHHTPPGINEWLQAIRDASTTVASSLLLPNDAQPKQRDKMWLTIHTAPVHLVPAGAHYTTDTMTYNL